MQQSLVGEAAITIAPSVTHNAYSVGPHDNIPHECCDIIQQGANMNQRVPESFSMLEWGLAPIMGAILPPRDPNEDDNDEDEDGDTEPDDEREPAVIREPDEGD